MSNTSYHPSKRNALESKIQRDAIKCLQKDGWLVVKLTLTNLPGMPDLMALKDGVARFFEVKRPGCKPRPLQEYRIKQLKDLGFEVKVFTLQTV